MRIRRIDVRGEIIEYEYPTAGGALAVNVPGVGWREQAANELSPGMNQEENLRAHIENILRAFRPKPRST